MSLNGLDDVHVTQAYQGALAEPGGWCVALQCARDLEHKMANVGRPRFLLQYTSRDAVEVLTRGTGGVADARTAVAQYQETSPLYGLLLYRRRKVLVKYVPEATSRLLKGTLPLPLSLTFPTAPS